MSTVREGSAGVSTPGFGESPSIRFRLEQNRPRTTSNTPSFHVPHRNNATVNNPSSSSSRRPALAAPSPLFLPFTNTQGEVTVIDLTGDSPPPVRRMPNPQEIIDVDALPDRPDTPDVTFTRRRFQPLRVPPPRPIEPNTLYSGFQHRSPQELNNPIMGHATRVAPIENTIGHGDNSPLSPANLFSLGLGSLFRQFTQPLALGSFGYSVNYHFQPPVNMDYRLGPNGIDPGPVEEAARERGQSYKKPPAAKDGFTRSPTEEDTLVCPSCESELYEEGEIASRETVWVGKCGHVYCGDCASAFRALPPRRKQRPGQPSGTCVVCNASLRGPKALWKVFL